MTDRLDVARGRDTVARWCALAEQRLEYLTELFETGRWRRFHSELSFLENIQEAKTAVAIWRDLSLHEASRHDFAAHIAWLGRTGATLPRGGTFDPEHRIQPQAAVADEPPPAINQTALDPAMDNASALTVDVSAMQERYPLLRNAL